MLPPDDNNKLKREQFSSFLSLLSTSVIEWKTIHCRKRLQMIVALTLCLIAAEMFISGVSFTIAVVLCHAKDSAVFYMELICSKSSLSFVLSGTENACIYFPCAVSRIICVADNSCYTSHYIIGENKTCLLASLSRCTYHSCLFNLMTVVANKMLHYDVVSNLISLEEINNCLHVCIFCINSGL
jgi:hypothetical protein